MLLKDEKQYGCLMVMVPTNYCNILVEFGKKIIPDKLLYIEGDEYGRETKPHCTVMYGFEPDLSEDQIKEVIGDVKTFKISVHRLDMFRPEEKPYDVVVLKVKSPELEEMHERANKLLNKDEYSEYTPHITIGYVKKNSVSFDKPINLSIVVKDFEYSPIHEIQGTVKEHLHFALKK